ncbi:MAG: rRNA maturation RNase YbeY [Eubacteriales bacterium]|nr:rRNA maturation RNase YbeY [Clostridium sp.]MCI7013198.1 rRNA maturation RNase YbeY [Clostridium sp.]MDD5980969.1 rRNA maturation RNase YbeY [Clostridium sp.]MDY6089195.1 rRNA maturation RNase YbeY [Eubacteriales bacterium]
MEKKNAANISFVGIEEDEGVRSAVELAANAALKHENAESRFLSVVLTTDENIHEYNREYRSVDRPTDVLSFPADEGDDLLAPPDGFLGDIMISIPRAREQAKALGHSTEREILFLTVHGVLHLLGYDHMRPEDEQIMLPVQRSIVEGIELSVKNRSIRV